MAVFMETGASHFQQIKGLNVTGHLELSGLRAAEDFLARSTDLYRIVS